MAEWIRWLLTVEALGLAALPLASWFFGALPDRGYGLSRVLGILLVGWLNWWLGSVSPLGNQQGLLWPLALLLLAAGGLLYVRGWPVLPDDRRGWLRTVAIEEAIFLAAFIGWTLVRLQSPDIYDTEKPMDMMLLTVSGATHSFPPPDAWLSGHTVNYYYLGYALFAMIGRMAGVDPRYGFNLANITIFALGCAGAYSIALALVRHRLWALAGPFATMIAGDLDGVRQLSAQIQNGAAGWRTLSLWCSTRVIDTPHTYSGSGTSCDNYRTITEFPIFSAIWNDLHPHYMALPFALLAIGTAVAALRDAARERVALYLWLGLAALVTGALFPINSWDFPTYLVLVLGAMTIAALRCDTLSVRRGLSIAAVAPVALLLYLPYYATVHLAGQGIGFNASASDIGDVIAVIGALLLPVSLFAVWRAIAAATLPRDESGQPAPLRAWMDTLPVGWGYWTALIVALACIAIPWRTDLLFVVAIGCAAYAIARRLRAENSEAMAALWLIVLGVGVLLVSEYVYLRDIFAGSPEYRMNTVFKLYYQAWLLLSFAAVFAVTEVWRALRRAGSGLSIPWAAGAAILGIACAVYPIQGIPGQPQSSAPSATLDGLAYLQQLDPDEYRAILWIDAHLPVGAVIAEAGGTDTSTNCGEYWVCPPNQSFDKISALTGRRTIIGWPGSHESLWRGAATDASASALLSAREADLRALYTTTDVQRALGILARHAVDYVYVGPVERTTYVDGKRLPIAVLNKFRQALKPLYDNGGVSIYQVPHARLSG